MLSHDQEIEIYHNPESLCSQKVRVALAEKGLDYKSHVVELSDITRYDPAAAGPPGSGTNLDPDYLRINPTGILPALVHKGEPVYDSYTIIQHLDEAYPEHGERLWPEAPDERKRLEEWLYESSLRNDVDLGASLGTSIAGVSTPGLTWFLKQQPLLRVIRMYMRHPMRKRGVAFIIARLFRLPQSVVKSSISTLAKGLVRIDRQLEQSQGPWLFGKFSQIDVTFMAVFHRLEDVNLIAALDHSALIHISDYWERLQSRPSYKEAILDWHNDWARHGFETVYGGGNPFLSDLEMLIEKASREDRG